MRLAAPPLTVLFFALGLHGCAATRTTGLFLMGAGSVVAFAGVYGLAGCTGDPPSACTGSGSLTPGNRAAAGVAIGTGWRHRRAIPAPHRAGNTTELAPVPAMDEPDVMPAVVSRPGPPGGRIAGVPPPWRCAPDCDDGLELRLWNVAEELEKAAMVEPGHYAEAARELASTRP